MVEELGLDGTDFVGEDRVANPTVERSKSKGANSIMQHNVFANAENKSQRNLKLGIYKSSNSRANLAPSNQRPAFMLESPGKFSMKAPVAHGFEKELAHESHLIQHSDAPLSHLSRQDID